ncbi:hypothetical protein C4802_21070, partial [Salmonella enterica subsp. enterica serovar Rubislaw]
LSKIDPPACEINGIFSKSGWPNRSNNAATGNTAIGSCNALPSRWKKPKIFILFPLRDADMASLKPFFIVLQTLKT